MSPPGFGRSSSARAFRVVEVFGLSGLIGASRSVTVTLWLEAAICSVKSAACFCPRPAITGFFSCAANPSASTFTEYGPGLSCGKLNRPAPSVCADRLNPFSTLVTVIFAPAMAAPAGSLIDPTIAAVVSPWPLAGARATRRVKITNAVTLAMRRAARSGSYLGMPKSNTKETTLVCQSESANGLLFRSAGRRRRIAAKRPRGIS